MISERPIPTLVCRWAAAEQFPIADVCREAQRSAATAAAPAYQLRRYAWSAKLPLSILTNFREFAVYDTRIRPEKDDKASKGRVFYCGFGELEDNWEWLKAIFAKEAILKGSFDKYVVITGPSGAPPKSTKTSSPP